MATILLVSNLGTRGGEAARAEFDRERMARAYEALYDTVTRG
jgi:hypothetical protein